jgi:hypothetical protein
MFTIFNLSLPTFPSGQPIKHFCSPCGIVLETCFEHLIHFQCSFPEFQVEFNTNALFLKKIPVENRGSHLTRTIDFEKTGGKTY